LSVAAEARTSAIGAPNHPLRVAVVGSGPSGFYAAESLLASGLDFEIDMLERLPVPYGLVRYGVAPDHAKLKSVTAVFAGIAQDPRFRFFGNVALGRDVDVNDLTAMYHAVIVATGADADRRLGIEGEHLENVHAASDFVGWYNGKPECAALQFDLSQDSAMVVGQGNVAIDVCRILAKSVDDLRRTDIAQHALDLLASSRVREIHLVGRRGPVQARFTPKELRELGTLAQWQVIVDPTCLDLNEQSKAELKHPDFVHAPKNLEILRAFASKRREAAHCIHLHFHRAPVALNGRGRLQQVVLETQRLEGAAAGQMAIPSGERSKVNVGLLFRSVGYRSNALPGLPFDDQKGILPNRDGRLLAATGEDLRGWYVTGWVKRGPTGIIGTNRLDSVETVSRLIHDIPSLQAAKPGRDALPALLGRKGHRVVTFADWLAIERAERERGLRSNKPSEKFVCIAEMLAAAEITSELGAVNLRPTSLAKAPGTAAVSLEGRPP
jgi:ferredoxin--NADP+ reductase